MITDVFEEYENVCIAPADALKAERRIVNSLSEPLPDTFLLVYSSRLIGQLCISGRIEPVEGLELGNCSQKFPVYRLKNEPIGLVQSGIGEPCAAGVIEELAELSGLKHLVMFGSCGTLTKIPEGRLIVPVKAYRDEGFSYHYAPASEYIELNNAPLIQNWLSSWGIDFVTGGTWTTDAFYRETERRAEQRIRDGCVAVEMECAGIQALCRFRGIELYSFLYAADSLNGTWQRRILGEAEAASGLAAFEAGRRIAAAAGS